MVRTLLPLVTNIVLLFVILMHIFFIDPTAKRLGFYCGELVAEKAPGTPESCKHIVAP